MHAQAAISRVQQLRLEGTGWIIGNNDVEVFHAGASWDGTFGRCEQIGETGRIRRLVDGVITRE